MHVRVQYAQQVVCTCVCERAVLRFYNASDFLLQTYSLHRTLTHTHTQIYLQ